MSFLCILEEVYIKNHYRQLDLPTVAALEEPTGSIHPTQSAPEAVPEEQEEGTTHLLVSRSKTIYLWQ